MSVEKKFAPSKTIHSLHFIYDKKNPPVITVFDVEDGVEVTIDTTKKALKASKSLDRKNENITTFLFYVRFTSIKRNGVKK